MDGRQSCYSLLEIDQDECSLRIKRGRFHEMGW
jgi:hypothetical protein